MKHSAHATSHTEAGTIEGEAAEIGRDPRTTTEAELNAAGHHKRRLLDAVRENCIGCCAGYVAEVRRCRMVQCPMWPYRMGTNPFSTKDLSDEVRQAASARLAAGRAKRAAAAGDGSK